MNNYDDDLQALGLTLSNFGKTMEEMGEIVSHAFDTWLKQLSDDEPWPWEHPVDWVLRVGRKKSGHNIYPDEAWRYRANLDWWHQRKQK